MPTLTELTLVADILHQCIHEAHSLEIQYSSRGSQS